MPNDALTRRERARRIVASTAWIGRTSASGRSRLGAARAEIVEVLRRSVASLPALDSAGGDDETWTRHRRELRRRIAGQDPNAFLTWDPIVRSMTFGPSPMIRSELGTLRRSKEWKSRWKCALRENRAGLPMPSAAFPFTSGTLIHHAYHLQRFETVTGRSITDFDEIVEFGGGYGSMARLITRLGFRGRYHIHDLPEFSALQRFYLASLAAEVGEGPLADALSKVACSSRLDAAPSKDEGKRTSLFLATWSLSESPIALREEWLPALGRFRSFLLGFQDRFDGMDNGAWFEGLMASRPDVEWHREPIAHRRGDFYLFGRPGAPLGA